MVHTLTFTALGHVAHERDAKLTMPDGHTGPVPCGLSLTSQLIEALKAQGWDVPFHWATDYSHAFEVKKLRNRFDVMVHCTNEAAGTWKVTIERRTGLFRWLIRKEPRALQQLSDQLYALLKDDSEVSELQATLSPS